MLILCRLVSRFFLNLRSVAHDNPLLLPRGTTGFALDTASPQVMMAIIMRRKPVAQNTNQIAHQNTAGPARYIGTSHRLGEADVIELSNNRISTLNIDFEAGEERLGPRDRECGHGEG